MNKYIINYTYVSIKTCIFLMMMIKPVLYLKIPPLYLNLNQL